MACRSVPSSADISDGKSRPHRTSHGPGASEPPSSQQQPDGLPLPSRLPGPGRPAQRPHREAGIRNSAPEYSFYFTPRKSEPRLTGAPLSIRAWESLSGISCALCTLFPSPKYPSQQRHAPRSRHRLHWALLTCDHLRAESRLKILNGFIEAVLDRGPGPPIQQLYCLIDIGLSFCRIILR